MSSTRLPARFWITISGRRSSVYWVSSLEEIEADEDRFVKAFDRHLEEFNEYILAILRNEMLRVKDMPHIVCQAVMDCIDTIRRYNVFMLDRGELNAMYIQTQGRVECIKKSFQMACKNVKRKKAMKERVKKAIKLQNEQEENF